MGRVWQILLFVGLLFWVFLLGRALWPALKKPSETRGLIAMVFLSADAASAASTPPRSPGASTRTTR